MLRVVAHKSAAAAGRYYTEGLKREDYYSEGQEIAGKWYGKAALELGLSGGVTAEKFAAMVENRHPESGKRLTARQNVDRVVGYDLNFHAPKSLSVLYALTGDKEILTAFRAAVAETMTEIEAQTTTRVRKGGHQENRVTGNLAWAEFLHFTSRPVGGIPDPHLHVHCFAFNATHDAEEGRWKAANFRDIKKDAPYSEAAFHSRLTEKLAGIGYESERTRQGWEVKGISRSIIEKFSRRTAEIERLAAEKGITSAKAKDALGAASREGKRHGLAYSDLVKEWRSRLTSEEKELISKVGVERQPGRPRAVVTPRNALDEACAKVFAKHSVVETKRLVAEALRFGVGHVSPEEAWREFRRRDMVERTVSGDALCTSVDVLAEEVALINFVRTGRSMHAPLGGKEVKFSNDFLSAEQKAAVRHLLESKDQVMAIRGGAGVGKTTLMKEAVAQIEAKGFKVFAFAPSAAASRETLREAGFGDAETVAHLLANPKLQERTRRNVIWIDEAGLLGVRDMWQIMKIAGHGTRVILTGDTAQHAPVPRGDSFRLMQKFAGLRIVEVTEIRRQLREEYRNAVASLSKGDVRTGFRRLEEIGAVFDIADAATRYRTLATDFLDLSRSGSVPLVVSPTHAEAQCVTEAIRDAKREAGLLGTEKSFLQYHNLNWEEADRRRGENYREGLVVQFHQNAPSILRGSILRVTGRDEAGGVKLADESGREVSLPLKEAARFQVFEEREIRLARGDRVRITRNGKSDDGRRINNGNVFTVEKFSRDGKIVLNTGAVLSPKHGHLAYGYCQTSHSSQSKSVKDVLVAQSAASFLASSKEGFYVSVSRGKETVRIYTDDRQGLQAAVGNTSTRRAAVELAGFSKQEISAAVSDDNHRWRDLIRSRHAEGASKSHVQKLLRDRRQEGIKKPENSDFRQYVQMRRGLAGADGKSRSKGTGGQVGKRQGNQAARGRSFLRPTELTTSTKGKIAAAKVTRQAAPAGTQTRVKRATAGLKAAGEHFRKVAGRVKGKIEGFKAARANRPRKTNPEQAGQHRVKQRNVKKSEQGKKQAKAQTKAPPPTVRKGR
ncbi:MAG: traI 3 [Pedosphaera sp.]|nr:traI 3 [Pedosphaera sp.]